MKRKILSLAWVTRNKLNKLSLEKAKNLNALSGLFTITSLIVFPLIPVSVHAGYAEAEAILENGTLGGTRGLRIRQIGGAGVLHSKNSNFVYYPASSIKVLQHLYGMTLVEDGTWDLGGTNGWVCDTDEDENCSAVPNTLACNAGSENMSSILSKMMRNSSNHHTNTVQERVAFTFYSYIPPFSTNMAAYGRGKINDFAGGVLGLNDTALNHKFGCGGFCGEDNANTMTLSDVEKVYRAIATNVSVISPQGRVVLKDHMLNESSSFINDIIDQEAAATGKNQWKEDFRDKVFKIWKSGSWTCSGNKYLSHAGLIQLPTHNGAYKRLYTWGAFAHDTQSWAYLPGTMGDTVKELLRTPIRAALLTWGFGFKHADSTGKIRNILLQGKVAESDKSVLAAIASLKRVEQALQPAIVDFEAVLENIGDAHRALNRTKSRNSSKIVGVLHDIAEVGHNVALDGLALASMTSEDAALDKQIAKMEIEIARGQKYMISGAGDAAMLAFTAVARMADQLVLWTEDGISHDDESVGFTDKAPLGITR